MFVRPPPARYAVSAATARGRLHHEPEAETRSPWQRDRDRIIHSSAFRKLQYKTQVFVNHEGDFYRTRLTHRRPPGPGRGPDRGAGPAPRPGPPALRPCGGGGLERRNEAVRRLRP